MCDSDTNLTRENTFIQFRVYSREGLTSRIVEVNGIRGR